MSSKSPPRQGAGGLPEWCAWEAAWLAEALAGRLAGARMERVRRAPGGGLLLGLDAPREDVPLVCTVLGRGAGLLSAPEEPRAAFPPAPAEWKSPLAGAALVGVAHTFPQRSLVLTFRLGPDVRRVLLDPVKSGGNLYLLDEQDRVLRRLRNRGHDAGAVVSLSSEPLPAWSEAAPGTDEVFRERVAVLPERLRENLSQNPPGAELLHALYGEAGDFLDVWTALSLPAWESHKLDALREAALAPLRREAKRLVRSLSRLAEDRAKLGDPDIHRRQGDLLAAGLHRARRGMDHIEVDDLYSESGGTVRLDLDPARSPQENLKACYDRYARARRGLLETERLERERRARLEEIERRLEAGDWRLEDVAPARSARPRQKQKPLPAGVQRWMTPEGYELYLGRSAEGNDRLVRQLLRGDDLWFHIADGTGSHVVLRRPRRGEDVPEAAILEAARLAHYNSSLREEKAAAVLCVPGKWVHKVKGAPGRATFSQPRTLMVDPDPKLFERLTRAQSLDNPGRPS